MKIKFVAPLMLVLLLSTAHAQHPSSGQAEPNGEPTPYWRALRRHPTPGYPIDAKMNGKSGKGLFRIKFDYESGHATDVVILKTTGYRDLDQAAIKALRN